MNIGLQILPAEIVNKIMLYNSHPVADLLKKSEIYNDCRKMNDDLDYDSEDHIKIKHLLRDYELELLYSNSRGYRIYCEG